MRSFPGSSMGTSLKESLCLCYDHNLKGVKIFILACATCEAHERPHF